MLRINHKEEKPAVKNILLIAATLGFCLFLSVLAPSTASADWSSTMGTGGGFFNSFFGFSKIELFIQTSSYTWSNPAVSNFSDGTWSGDKINSTYVLATSTSKTYGTLYWDALFTGVKPADGTTFTVDALVYRNLNSNFNSAYGVRMSTTDGGRTWTTSILWDKSTYSQYDRTPTVTPVPPTVFLLGAGLIGIAILRKRVRSKDITS